jgi:hypothetical protein
MTEKPPPIPRRSRCFPNLLASLFQNPIFAFRYQPWNKPRDVMQKIANPVENQEPFLIVTRPRFARVHINLETLQDGPTYLMSFLKRSSAN